MSDTLHIVSNDDGSGDKVAVIFMGDVIYQGSNLSGKDLYSLLEGVNGCFEYLEHHTCDDEEMLKPYQVVYGEDDDEDK